MIKRFFALVPVVMAVNLFMNVVLPILLLTFVFGMGAGAFLDSDVSDNPCEQNLNMKKVFVTFDYGCDAGKWLAKESE